MNKNCIFILVLCFAVIAASSYRVIGQSGRENQSTDSKANRRPVKPSPIPTPDRDSGSDQTVANADAENDDGEIIRVNTQLVSIPVRVMDKNGRFIGGLSIENFKVFEDGAEQEVALFANEHQPFTVALVLDMSYSTTFKISEIQAAAIAFIDQLRTQDKVMVISFDEDVHILCEATDDRQAIYRAIKSTRIATGTSLYEAVDIVMNDRLRRIDGRKAIILFTDGVDTSSRRKGSVDNLVDAMELDALIYPIRYDTFADVQKMKNGSIIPKFPPITAPVPQQSGNPFPFPIPTVGTPSNKGTTVEDYENAREYLEQLAYRTGGRIYLASNLDNLSDGFSKIASELREYYSLGYYPQNDRTPGKRTKIKVKVDREGLVVRTRDGFVVSKKQKNIGQ